MFPAGSTLDSSVFSPPRPGEPPDAEAWIVPLAVADEIADLRVQLPIGEAWGDGRPWCGEHSIPTAGPGAIAWTWGTPNDGHHLAGGFVEISVQAGGLKTSKVMILTQGMTVDPGCP
jgi:hypothetical protein